MKFFAAATALIGAVAASNIEARWATTSSSSVCTAATTTTTVTVTAWGAPPAGGKGSWGNGTAPTPTPTKVLYHGGASSVTYGGLSVVVGLAAAMLL